MMYRRAPAPPWLRGNDLVTCALLVEDFCKPARLFGRAHPFIHVRFGSKADMCSAKRHVRFTPKATLIAYSGFYVAYLGGT